MSLSNPRLIGLGRDGPRKGTGPVSKLRAPPQRRVTLELLDLCEYVEGRHTAHAYPRSFKGCRRLNVVITFASNWLDAMTA
jgi:hypothetical protein